MDMIHFTPDINQYMMQCISEGKCEVTDENMDDVIGHMRQVYEYIINEGIYRYYSTGG